MRKLFAHRMSTEHYYTFAKYWTIFCAGKTHIFRGHVQWPRGHLEGPHSWWWRIILSCGIIIWRVKLQFIHSWLCCADAVLCHRHILMSVLIGQGSIVPAFVIVQGFIASLQPIPAHSSAAHLDFLGWTSEFCRRPNCKSCFGSQDVKIQDSRVCKCKLVVVNQFKCSVN